MKWKIAGWSVAVAVLVSIVLVVRQTGKLPNAGPLPATVLLNSDPIITDTPRRQDFTETCRWFGKVESRDKARIVALETGRIVSVNAEDEMPVSAAALLFTIGGPLIDSRLKVLRDKSATLQKRAALAERMVSVKQKAVSQKLAKYEELFSARETLARLKAELESVRQEIQRFQEAVHVRATLNGVFTNRGVSVGQEVRQGDYLAEIISVSHIYIAATLFPRAQAVLKGKQAVINLASGNTLPGTITRILPRKTAEGAVAVWIAGSALDPVLRPGEAVTGTVVFAVHKGMLAIPQNAVVRDEQERAYVFLQNSSGYRKQPVRTGIVSGDRIEIMSGLKEGDAVVVRGAYELFYRDFNKIYKVAD